MPNNVSVSAQLILFFQLGIYYLTKEGQTPPGKIYLLINLLVVWVYLLLLLYVIKISIIFKSLFIDLKKVL
jgi:hypothetical protein